MMVGVIRLRLDLSYRGTDFSGWATQPGLRTVQGALEEALARVLRLPSVRLTVAGRTDAGVHSRGQVAHLDVPREVWEAVVGRSGRAPGDALVSRLAGVLPTDVVVHRAAPAPQGFDARFSALQAHRGRMSGLSRAAKAEDKRASARLMAAQGYSSRAIAASLGVNQSTVVRWLGDARTIIR